MSTLAATAPSGETGPWGFHDVPRALFDALPMKETEHVVDGVRPWWSKRVERTFRGRRVAVLWLTDEPPVDRKVPA